MKKIIPCLLLAALAACTAKKEAQPVVPPVTEQEEVVAPGPVASKDWIYSQTLNSGGHRFEIALERSADSTLQVLKDADGAEYLDNKVHLRLAVDGVEKLDRTFTKRTFEPYVPAGDLARSLLHGIAFDCEENGILLFGAHVGSPDDDVNYYYAIKVDKDGGIVIARDYQQDTSPVH